MTRISVMTLASVPAALRRVSTVSVQRRVAPESKRPLCHAKLPLSSNLAEAQSPSALMRKPLRSDEDTET